MDELNEIREAAQPEPRVSAKAARHDGSSMTEAEIEAAEEEALAWARKSNCC